MTIQLDLIHSVHTQYIKNFIKIMKNMDYKFCIISRYKEIELYLFNKFIESIIVKKSCI